MRLERGRVKGEMVRLSREFGLEVRARQSKTEREQVVLDAGHFTFAAVEPSLPRFHDLILCKLERSISIQSKGSSLFPAEGEKKSRRGRCAQGIREERI